MDKYLKLLIIVLVCIMAGLLFFSSHKSSLTEAPKLGKNFEYPRAVCRIPDNLETLTDVLGAFLKKGQSGEVTETDDLSPFVGFWPDIAPLVVRENFTRRGQEPNTDYMKRLQEMFPCYATDEAEHIYQFLFADGAERRSYINLAKSLCFERLERVGSQLSPESDKKVPWIKCPLSGENYILNLAENKLRCPHDRLSFKYPDRLIVGRPEEIYRQLAMGYYNYKRLHRLDKVLLGHGVAAVRRGEKVADIGCGVGCYVWSLAEGAGPDGLVYAQDVNESVLSFVDFVKKKRAASNVKVCLAQRDNPCLPGGSLDRIFMIDVLNVIAGIDYKVRGEASPKAKQYLHRLISCLAKDGKLVVIDFLPYANRPHLAKEQVCQLFNELDLELIGEEEAASEPSPMYALTFRRKINRGQ
ncbi:MAG: class I SAM-dependent methyltransferase [Candidatus Bruticola sp.]